MNYAIISETISVSLNLASMFWNISSMRRSSKTYLESSMSSINQIHEMRVEFMDHITELQELYEEEIKLLKTNEGLYDLRNDPEQYAMYLKLLSDGKINRGNK